MVFVVVLSSMFWWTVLVSLHSLSDGGAVFSHGFCGYLSVEKGCSFFNSAKDAL